jgi:hypothetical protein
LAINLYCMAVLLPKVKDGLLAQLRNYRA